MSTAVPPGEEPEREEGAEQEPVEGAPRDDRAEDPGKDPDGVDVDAAWAQILAHWEDPAVDSAARSPARPGRHRGLGPQGQDSPDATGPSGVELRRRRTDHPVTPAQPPAPPSASPLPPPAARPAPRPAPPSSPPSRGLPDGRGGTERDPLDDEHWEAPEPPPLPRAGWRSWLPWVGVLGVPFFFVVVVIAKPELPPVVMLVAVLGFVAGFVTLVLRLPSHRDDDGDDGARL